MSNIVKAGGPAGTNIAREGVGGRELEQRHETAASLEQASARAEIEARSTVAMMRPRDPDQNRSMLLKDCARPGFARRAFYSMPRRTSQEMAKPGRITGKTPEGPDNRGKYTVAIEGLSVRFAETAIRTLGNIDQRSRTVYDDAYKRRVQVGVVDLETNASYSDEVIIDKTVERAYCPDGVIALGQRLNSAGKPVYLLPTTEEELRQKQQALVSRVFRTLALRLVPPDTLEECERQIGETVKDQAAKDPDAERKAIADAFASLNVMPADLKAYMGHDLGTCTPAELVNLRGLFEAIREGEITWADAVKERTAELEAEATSEKPKTAGGRVAQRVKERVAKQAAKKAGKAPAAAAGTPPPPAQAPQAQATGAGSSPPVDPPAASPGKACEACGTALEGNACPSCGWVVGQRIPS